MSAVNKVLNIDPNSGYRVRKVTMGLKNLLELCCALVKVPRFTTKRRSPADKTNSDH